MTKPMRVDGVDISHHQSGNLDYPLAKRRGLRWLYHKATEGTTVRDANYSRRRAEAAKHGVPFGAYHFARADRGDARAEARYFLDYAQPKPGDLRPALDLETTEGLTLGQLRQWAADFIDEVKKRTGEEPVVYTPFNLGTADDDCLVWRPRYNNSNVPPVLPWDIWQFSNGVYGVPNSLAGFGRVDLNVMRNGLAVEDMRLPAPKPDKKPKRKRKTVRMHAMEVSMQFSDSDRQKEHDARAIFRRARRRGVWWVAGTEAGAGSGTLRKHLKNYAKENGYRFWMNPSQDSWIAVRKENIKKGSFETYFGAVIPGRARLHTGKGVLAVTWRDAVLGDEITVIASHYLTRGRPGAKDPAYRARVDDNRRLAREISDYARKAGKGKALVFFAGDTNIVDRVDDVFFGKGPLETVGDELEKWPNTGHGPIDVIASSKRDGRVKAAYWRALNDKKFFLNTDHFLVEAGFDIEIRK